MRRETVRAFKQFFKELDHPDADVSPEIRQKIKRVLKALDLETCTHTRIVNESCERCGERVGIEEL